MLDVVVQIPEEVEAAPQRRLRSANAPLSAEQTVKILRARYPDALICVDLHCVNPLIATQRKSYALSRPVMTEERRLNFTCARCRQEAAERERVHASRVEKGRKGYAARSALETPRRLPIPGPVENDPIRVRPTRKPAPVKENPGVEMGQLGSDSGIPDSTPLPASLARMRRRKAARTRGRQAVRDRKRDYRARQKGNAA